MQCLYCNRLIARFADAPACGSKCELREQKDQELERKARKAEVLTSGVLFDLYTPGQRPSSN